MNGRPWTTEELRKLKNLLKTEKTYEEIGVELSRTEAGIQKMVSKLKLTGSRVHRSKSPKTKEKISKAKMGSIPWNKGKKGLQVSWVKGKSYDAIKGEKNPKWNGGVKVHRDGYIYLLKKDHPHATANGYVMEHILVMEEKLGRLLNPGEVVHHINGQKNDNRPENLMLFSSIAEHQRHHWKLRKEEKHGKFGCINW